MRKKLFVLCVIAIATALLLTACAGVELTLTFEVDGEVYATVNTMGQETVKMPKDPEKEGYTFDGWYWDKDVWEKPFTANSLLESPLSENMTVYARFVNKTEIEQFTVTFDANGGIFETRNSTMQQIVAKNSTLTAPTSPTRSGYNFSGWATDAEGSEMWQFGTNRVVQNLTLFAVWNQQSAAVLSVEGAQIDGMEIHMLVSPETESVSLSNKVVCSADSIWKLYYDRLGQTEIPTKIASSKQGELLDGDNKFYLVVTSKSGAQVNTYTFIIHRSYLATITYLDGETVLKTSTFYTGNSFNADFIPILTGYTFHMWTRSGGTQFEEGVLWESTALQAVKTANTYTVTYDAGEGELSQNTATVTYNENYRLAVPTRVGYSFTGWKNNTEKMTDENGNSLTPFKKTENITVTAQWVINEYTLTLKNNVNGGTITGEGKYSYRSRAYVSTQVYNGYRFTGWYDKGGELVSASLDYNFIITEDSELTAKYEYAILTLNYVVDGITSETEKFTLDKPITQFAQYKGNNHFVGWYRNANFNVNDSKITTTAELVLSGDNAYLYGGTYVGTEGQEFSYTKNGYALSAFLGSATEIDISSTFNGKQVVTINASVFRFKNTITQITIPSSISSIGSQAFWGGRGLTIYAEAAAKPSGWNSDWNYSNCPVVWDCKNNDVADDGYIYTIQNGIRYGIKDGAAMVAEQPINITEANIASEIVYKDTRYRLTSIGTSAFYGCSNLTELKMPAEVAGVYGANNVTKVVITSGTSIGSSAFWECSSLQSIAIPDSVTSIGHYAFYECSNLTSITIPDSVTSIGTSAFYQCSSLTIYAEVAAKPNGWESIDCPVVWNYKNNDVADDGYIYTIQNGVRYGIKDGAAVVMRQPSNITEANIASEIVYKDTRCSVTSIGSSAFRGCSSLTSIAIPDSVTSIGTSAFYECSSLTSITIPDSVTSIGSYAFYYCSGLETITVAEGNTKYHSAGNCLIETATKTLILGCKNSVIPTDGSVTNIGSHAFDDCSGLTSITIPDSVKSIGSQAFWGGRGLTIYAEAAAKPSGWDSGWNYSNCPVVWDYKNNDVADDGYIYTIQNGLRYGIKDGAAVVAIQPSNITKANIASEIVYKETNYSVTSIGDRAFAWCDSLTSITIPDSVTSIGNVAFYDCSSLLSIAIPDSVTSIGNSAFSGCSSLTSIEIPDSVTSIGTDAFSGCDGLETIMVAEGNTKYHSAGNCLIETATKTLIAGCKASVIPTDGSVTSIGEYAFRECSNLTSIAIPNSVTSIGKWAFKGCSSLQSIAIPDNVTSIGYEAFYGCSGLTSIVIPNSVTSIGDFAFRGCSSLTSIAIPDSVTSIGDYAFGGCSGLTSIAIPDSVTSIGDCVFSYCYDLSSIEYQGTKAEWKAITKGSRWNNYISDYTVKCTDGTLTKSES